MRSQKDALRLTQEIMEKWYDLKPEVIYPYLDAHITWIGAADRQFFVGFEQVKEALEKTSGQMLPCFVTDQYYLIADSGRDFCVVAGRIVVTLKDEERLLSEPQRVTFIWKEKDGALLISHIHVSNNAAVVAPDEAFPLRASRHAYEFIMRRLEEDTDIVTLRASDSAIYRISRGCTLYLEAANEYMLVHTKTDTIRVHRSMGGVYRELFPDFIMIHRSLCVNPLYIRLIREYETVLTDGTVLPIARAKYRGVCEKFQSD